MVKGTVTDVVKFLEQCLKEKRVSVSKIILFGSQAEERATEDSDIDVVVISEDFHNKDIFERAGLIKEAEIKTVKKFMKPLDIITLTPEEFENETSLVAEYAKGGVRNMTEAERIMGEIRSNMPYLREQYNVKSLGVFGSHVRGEQKERSDLDILVEFEEPVTLLEFMALERRLNELTGKKVDLVMKTALKPKIGERILDEVVYL
jgi:predicted nucleotidyltransferase